MAKIDLQYDIVNYTPASATPVESNFNRLEQHINQELIERGGTVSMTAQLKLVGNPISPLDATPKQYVDQMLPVGIVMLYGGTGAPPGGRWAVCNGAELETVLYPTLYGAIGRNFSPAGTPGGRFNLPNLQGRVALGTGAGTTIGTTGGSADGVVAAHSHPLNASSTGPPSGTHTHIGGAHNHHLAYSTTLDANARHQHNYISSGLLRASPHDTREGGERHRLALAAEDEPGIDVHDISATPMATLISGPDFPTHAHDFGGVTQTEGHVPTSGSVENQPHTHTLSGSTASTGTTAAGSNLPPYVAMPYIMRVS